MLEKWLGILKRVLNWYLGGQGTNPGLSIHFLGPQSPHLGFSVYQGTSLGARGRPEFHPGWSAVAQSWLSAASISQAQEILLPQLPK